MNLDKILQNIGLSEKEVKVYLAIQKLKAATVAEISKESKLKRTSIYPYLEELKIKGLIEWGSGSYEKIAKINEPNKILIFAKNKERKYGRAVLELNEIMPELQKSFVKHLDDVEIKFYNGVEECRNLMMEYMKAEGEITGYLSWWRYVYLGHDWCKKWEREFYAKAKFFTRSRYIVSATEHNLFHGEEYTSLDRYNKTYFFKFIPPKEQFIKVDIVSFNDIKIILSFRGVKPNGIFIRNKDLVESDKAIFELLYHDVALEYQDYIKKHNIDITKLKHVHD